MTQQEYAFLLGRIHGNLLSLELCLRAVLCHAHKEPMDLPSPQQQQPIQETYLTNFDTLGQLIKKYNTLVASTHKVDGYIVILRDALAHGRIIAPTPSTPYRLFKFTKPEKGMVKVAFDQVIDKQWLVDQDTFIKSSIEKIMNGARALGLTPFR